jgi:Cdc6-like AAA superfamily ATPase
LSLQGSAGTGKTILASMVVEDLVNDASVLLRGAGGM